MYIVELVVKLLKNKDKKKEVSAVVEEEECEHVFLPIDSTKKTLACSKCGMVIKADEIKAMPKNPFFL